MEELKGDANVLQQIDDAQALLKTIRKTLGATHDGFLLDGPEASF